MSENRDTRATFSASRVTLICRLRYMFLQSAFPFSYLVFFPWNLAWNSLYTVENPNLLVCRLNSPQIGQRFSSFSMARSKLIIIFTRTVLLCLFFFSKSNGRKNAKYAFQHTFENNTTQHKRKDKEKKEQSRDLHDDIRVALLKNRVSRDAHF